MKKLMGVMAILLCVVALTGCGLKDIGLGGDVFSGKWIGIIKLPVVGKTVMRLEIIDNESSYRVNMTADYYREMSREELVKKNLGRQPGQSYYTWQTGNSASFTGKRLDDYLRLDNTLGMSLAVGKVTGTLVLPDGKVIYKDTGEQYPKFKAELAEEIKTKEPGAVIVD